MESNPPQDWYCCVYESERTMLRVTAQAFLLTLFLGMPLELWLATWAVTGRGDEPYREAFLHLYHAEIGTMMVDGSPVDAVVPLDDFVGWWGELALWTLTPGAVCADGCPQSQRPVM